ncbi:MAG TPA: extracellular solute-binding protein [Alphaproteobacteria bacterium]|nr:extracellular solute-binding protein [Alphaproteobacteria bacterium]
MELDQVLTNSISRRNFMALAGASVLTAQGATNAFAQAAPLNWFAFGTAYSDPYLLEPFVKAGVPVKETPWTGADEMLAKLRGGGSQLFDCASIPQQFVQQVAKDGLIDAIDLANVPNFSAVFPEFRTSPYVNADGKLWGVPWIWGANAIAYNKKDIPDVTSMSALFDEKNKGRVSMRDDPEDSLAVAALYLGIKEPFKMGESELQEVKKLLLKQKPLIRSYWKSVADLQTLFANNEISVAWSQLAIIDPLRNAKIDMGWVWPKEGVLGFFNGQCTIKGTARKKDAEAFANFLIGPDYGVRLAEKTGYATTSDLARAKMSPDLVAKAGIDPARLKLLKFKELIPNRPTWQRTWDEVKAG